MAEDAAPRILISRMSAIGDAILTLPVACALRDHFPNAYIAWVVEKKAAPMIRNHRALDQVIEFERGWFTSIHGIRDAREQLLQHKFDITIDCQGLTKSALAGRLSGARKRIGFGGSHGGELSRLLNNTLIKPVFTHVTDRSLELLIPLGVHSPKVRWKLPIPPEAQSWASRWRSHVPSESLAALNPGATWASKLWEPDRFASIARYVHDRYNYRSVVVWGTAEEKAMAEEIVRLSNGAATLAPETNLHHLAALIETADLFISADTGPLHLAVAVGTSTIGLYGSTRPGDSGPYGQVAIQKAYESGTRRHRRSADNSAMRQISVEHVCEAIDELESKRELLKSAA
jgi:lipopolysaccharide heptosyltransferase I